MLHLSVDDSEPHEAIYRGIVAMTAADLYSSGIARPAALRWQRKTKHHIGSS